MLRRKSVSLKSDALDKLQLGNDIRYNLTRYRVVQLGINGLRLKTVCCDCWLPFEFGVSFGIRWLRRRCEACVKREGALKAFTRVVKAC